MSAPGNDVLLTCARSFGAARVFSKPFVLAEIVSAAEQSLLQA